MQIIIDQDNYNKLSIQKTTHSVVYGFCLGFLHDHKIHLLSFIRFKNMVYIHRNQLTEIARLLNQYLKELESNSIDNQKCLGLMVEDSSKEKEILIPLILREMKLESSFVVLIKQMDKVKSMYYDWETKLVNQQSNSQIKLMSQIRFGRLEMEIDLGFDRFGQLAQQWVQQSDGFEISINNQLVCQDQWNLRFDNMFKKQGQKIFDLKVYLRNRNRVGWEGKKRLKGKLRLYLQFNCKCCLKELREMIGNALVEQLQKFEKQHYYELDGEQIIQEFDVHYLQIERLQKLNRQVYLKTRYDRMDCLEQIFEIEEVEDQDREGQQNSGQIDHQSQQYYQKIGEIFKKNEEVRVQKQIQEIEQERKRQEQEQERLNREKIELQQRQKEKEESEKIERLKQIESQKKQVEIQSDQEKEDQKSLIKFVSVLVLLMSVMYVKFNYV